MTRLPLALPLALPFMALLAACSQSAPTGAPANEPDTGAADTAAAPATVTLARLDCGTIEVSDLNVFSQAGAYPGQTRTLTDSCYLIRHGDTAMLWDTGLPGDLKGKTMTDGPFTVSLDRTIAEQLAPLGLTPDDIAIVGVSHYHFDHTGQLADFPKAKLVVGAADWNAVRSAKKGGDIDPAPYARWLTGGGIAVQAERDLDIFGDGSVTLLTLPGHTPGHTGLKVVTGDKTYLLTGDVAHFHANYDTNDVPTWNTDKADSVASLKRFKQIAEKTGATVVIQHDPADIGLVPAARASAK